MNLAASLLYAVATSVVLATALGMARHGLDSFAAWASLTAGLLVGAWSAWVERRNAKRMAAPGPWEWLILLVFALASARAFLWLVFTDGDRIQILSPNNLGDLALHLTYIRNLAGGVPFWPDNPIFVHGKLTYPVGVDLFNTLLTLAGVDVFRGLIWTGLTAAALTAAALWRWGRGLAVLAFLGNGGLAGFAVLTTLRVADFQSELAWKSFFLALFVTQRGLLFALPAGLLLLASWRTRFFDAGDGWRLPRWGEWLLYASMPLFHLHTFIFLSLMLASWFVLHPPARRGLAELVAAAFVPATLLTLMVTGAFHGGVRVLGLKPGWMWDDLTWLKWCEDRLPGSPYYNAALLFWPINFGFLIPFVIWLGVHLWKNPRATWPRALFFPALAIFLLCVFVKFAPWEWDNTKLMLWSYLAIVPLAWTELLAARPLWQRAGAAVVLFGSGLVSLCGGLDGNHTGYDLATRSELDAVAKAVAPIAVTERFVAYPTYNHPLLLVGRKLMLGYPGHVLSHGLPWEETSAQVEILLNGEPGWQQVARKLGARYLFWGTQERDHYKASSQPWKRTARLIAEGDWGELYDLHTPR